MTINYLDSKRISALSSDALVAHLKFNDNVTDSAGSNNGTVTGTTTYVAGKINNAFSFNGSSYITLANESNFDIDYNEPFSIAFWYKTNNTSYNAIYGKGNNTSPYSGIQIGIYLGKIQIDQGSAYPSSYFTKDQSTAVTANVWHHAVMTLSGSGTNTGCKLYVDGSIVPMNTASPDNQSASILNNISPRIGYDGNNYYNTGLLDDVRIYSREIDQSEVTMIYNSGTGTEENRPTNVQDNSILVEKDTGKRYWFDGSTWIWGNPILPTVAGLKLHLDASDSSTITIATGVSQWNDKSGQGNHVTQATGSKQPLLVNSSLNGKAVIRFNGTDEWMSRTSYTGGTLTQPTSIFGVYSWPSGSTTRRVLDSANNSSRHVIYLGSAGQHGIFAGSELLGAGSPNSTDRLQYTALFNTTSSSLRKSKTTILSGTTGTQIMDGIMLAASSGTNSFGDIDIAELLVYNATVSTVDRDAIEDYLTVKWGL